jgi:Mrp family chromosome partitioning ATPase
LQIQQQHRSPIESPPRRKVQPAEFTQPYPENHFETPPATSPSAHPLEGLTKREIIQTISSAIISVLTDQAEPLIDAKVKQHLKDLQLELVAESEPVWESSINPSEPVYPYSPPEDQNASTFGAPPQFRKKSDIPMNIAAWDVGEFRWPLISDQMIKVGADSIQALSSTVLTTLAGTRRRVAVTGPSRRAGTTSIAISLARWAASEGARVLLVDADLAHPELSSLVGLGPGISWWNMLNQRDLGQPQVAEYIIRSQQTPICVMPLFINQGQTRSAAKLFDQLGHLLDPVSFDFDLILLDTGPVSQIVAELSVGQPLIDTALIVHQDKDFTVTQAQNQLRALDVEQFVFAQNSVRPARSIVA